MVSKTLAGYVYILISHIIDLLQVIEEDTGLSLTKNVDRFPDPDGFISKNDTVCCAVISIKYYYCIIKRSYKLYPIYYVSL